MQSHVGIAGHQRRPLFESLLYPVFAKVPLAGLDQLLDFLSRAPLAYRDQPDVRDIAVREQRGALDAIEDLLPSCCGSAHDRRYRNADAPSPDHAATVAHPQRGRRNRRCGAGTAPLRRACARTFVGKGNAIPPANGEATFAHGRVGKSPFRFAGTRPPRAQTRYASANANHSAFSPLPNAVPPRLEAGRAHAGRSAS